MYNIYSRFKKQASLVKLRIKKGNIFGEQKQLENLLEYIPGLWIQDNLQLDFWINMGKLDRLIRQLIVQSETIEEP